jgi:hypothetical protein
VRCGRCGALLHLHYSGKQGEFPEYRCSADQSQFGGTDCQRVRALALDTQVEQRFLQALQPDQLTLALAALAQLEQEEQAENKQWELRLERARYQAKRAERQYQAVEPENRLVARSLEKQWEERLRAVETVEKEHHAWKVRRFGTLTQADREAIVALGSDLPALWPAETTTNTERKQMLRLVIREVIVVSSRAQGQVWVQINWQTGAQEQFWYQRRVNSYAVFTGTQALEQRVREQSVSGADGCSDCSDAGTRGLSDPWASSPDYEQDRLSLTCQVADPDSEAEQQSTEPCSMGRRLLFGRRRCSQAGCEPGYDLHLAKNGQTPGRAPGQKHALENLCGRRG